MSRALEGTRSPASETDLGPICSSPSRCHHRAQPALDFSPTENSCWLVSCFSWPSAIPFPPSSQRDHLKTHKTLPYSSPPEASRGCNPSLSHLPSRRPCLPSAGSHVTAVPPDAPLHPSCCSGLRVNVTSLTSLSSQPPVPSLRHPVLSSLLHCFFLPKCRRQKRS